MTSVSRLLSLERDELIFVCLVRMFSSFVLGSSKFSPCLFPDTSIYVWLILSGRRNTMQLNVSPDKQENASCVIRSS